MRNWSVDEKELKKSPYKYKIWMLTQLISYGLDKGEKLKKEEVIACWPEIEKNLDPSRREFINYLLWKSPS